MPKTFTFDVEFSAPIEDVWRIVSDTDALDAASGMPEIAYRDEPQSDGTTRRFCHYKMHGFSFDYEEMPFTWVHEQRYEVKRVFSKGAFKTFRHACEIIPRDADNPDAGCTVRTTFEFEPHGFLGLFTVSGIRNNAVSPYKKVFSDAAERLSKRKSNTKRHTVQLRRPIDVEGEPKPIDVDAARLTAITRRTRTLYDSPLADRLAEAVRTLPAEQLRPMHPYAFARPLSADRH